MKKALTIFFVVLFLANLAINIFATNVYAESDNGIIDEVTSANGNLLKLKADQAKSLEDYKQKYGSDSYGLTAYILHVVQVYSIPFCFLGIIISVIYKVVLGSRHLENAEKGLGMIVAIVTLTIICQVLPLVFALVVKIGRE
ncbi:MAG: hypothetical protein IJK18_09420 [Clostridia bacterium]|nr:hypothetical protein [Clostridia bacterium]